MLSLPAVVTAPELSPAVARLTRGLELLAFMLG